VGGAFVDLERQLERKNSGGMGFGATINKEENRSYLAELQPEDLIKYGLIPEFVGRFSMITHVNHLSELQLVSVLTDPKNSLLSNSISIC
jgi:ATP-dependent Clp protease ATP-binding subunit ClpX